MSVDIRLYTRAIVRKNNRYLQGKSLMTNRLIWCASPWDAWWTKDAETARTVARVIGGTAMLFNPVARKEAVM